MDMSNMRSARGLRGAVSAVLVVAALFTSVLVTPAGAQAPPTATAEGRCFDDGVGWIVVTVDDAAGWAFTFFLDGEEEKRVIAPGPWTYAIGGLEDGTYALVVSAEMVGVEPFEVLSAEVTVDCDEDPPPTTAPTETTAPSTAPEAADRSASRPLSFTG